MSFDIAWCYATARLLELLVQLARRLVRRLVIKPAFDRRCCFVYMRRNSGPIHTFAHAHKDGMHLVVVGDKHRRVQKRREMVCSATSTPVLTGQEP